MRGFEEGLIVGIAIGLGILLIYVFTSTPSKTQSYSNVEEWEIVKDPETGRVRGVRVHRRAVLVPKD
jgi:hypothetical protein